MQNLVTPTIHTVFDGNLTLLSAESIINRGYSKFSLVPGQFSLQQPWQRQSVAGSKRRREGSPCNAETQQPAPDSVQLPPDSAQTVLQAHRQLLQLLQAAAYAAEQLPAAAQHVSHATFGQEQYHETAVPVAPTVQTRPTSCAAAGPKAGKTQEAGASKAAAAAPYGADASAINSEAVESHGWPAVATFKHVLKPKLCFSYVDANGRQQSVCCKLFNAVVHNNSSTEVVATAHDRQVLLPAGCSFCMSDLKAMAPFVKGECRVLWCILVVVCHMPCGSDSV